MYVRVCSTVFGCTDTVFVVLIMSYYLCLRCPCIVDINIPHYQHDFEPTPFDQTKFKIWYIIGDMVPFEMDLPIKSDILKLKEYIMDTKKESKYVAEYLKEVEDASTLKIYPAGSYGNGDPLDNNLPVPRDSSNENFFFVLREE